VFFAIVSLPPTHTGARTLHPITVLASHLETFSEVVRHRLLNLYQLDVYKNV
jgi:hypothetical protein